MTSRDREQYFGKLQGDIEKSLPSFWGGKKWSRDMSMGVMKPSSIIKGVIPVIMAGILGIYGLIVALF